MPLAIDDQINLLDELLSRLEQNPRSKESEIAHEHFQEARVYLLGAMYGEYALNLELGRRAVDAMPDQDTRSELNQILSRLTDAGHLANRG